MCVFKQNGIASQKERNPVIKRQVIKVHPSVEKQPRANCGGTLLIIGQSGRLERRKG